MLFDAQKAELKEYIDVRTGYRKKRKEANFTDGYNENSKEKNSRKISCESKIAEGDFFRNVDVEDRQTEAFVENSLFFLYALRNREKLKEKLASERGITLISLIITVVIMIILAAVTINVTLGDGGIIDQAKTAAEATVNSAQSEQEQLDSLEQELANILAEPVDPTEGVPIPEGFYYVGGTKAEGIVISDSPEDENKGTSHEAAQNMQGNQFVWIPVEDDSAFQRYSGYRNGSNQNSDLTTTYTEPFANGYASERSEYDAMKANVLENDGFYVGRYEAGTTNSARSSSSGITDEVLVQQGKYVYNYVGWSNNNAMTVETGGAVELSKNFANQKGYSSVTSSLIYGVQWDAIMNFIDPAYATGTCAEDSFVRDSSGKGNYNGESGSPAVTGASANYAVKNIYDLGGNVYEWTMEASSTSSRVYRGGLYSYSGSDLPASFRDGNNPSSTYVNVGFRPVLYLK